MSGGRTDSDGLHHVRWMEVRAGTWTQCSRSLRPLQLHNGQNRFRWPALCHSGPALRSDWLLQLVSVGYGRAQKSEFFLIVSREVKGEESSQTHPAHSREVCPTIPCPLASGCMRCTFGLMQWSQLILLSVMWLCACLNLHLWVDFSFREFILHVTD